MSYTLVTGGVRSGKSRIAERLAGHTRRVLYVATGAITDAEMAERIRMHQARRPARWGLLETAGMPLTEAVRREMERAEAEYEAVLIDCLSTWVSDLLIKLPEAEWRSEATRAQVLGESEQLGKWLQDAPFATVVVTSETGLGGVAMSPLGRAFQDLLGEVNQIMAQRADEVYLAVSGLAMRLTGA